MNGFINTLGAEEFFIISVASGKNFSDFYPFSTEKLK
jgi:hypothetical protein